MTNKSTVIYCEDELVMLLQKRNRATFNYLYEKYSKVLYFVIYRRINDKHTALDILQEVFVNIWKNIGSYNKEKGRFYTWMHRIAVNKTLDFVNCSLYKNQRKCTVILPDTTIPIKQNTNTIGIGKLVDKLLPKYNTVVKLFYFNGYTLPEIAVYLGVPLGTVKTRLRYALSKLREDYAYVIPIDLMNER